MSRGYTPAVTLIVFGVGIGIGFAWHRGFIPLHLTAPNSGKLGIEVTQREDLPLPPPDASFSPGNSDRYLSLQPPVDDREIFEKQSEPGPEIPNIAATSKSWDSEDADSTSASQRISVPEPAQVERDVVAKSDRKAEGRVRTRDRNPVRLDPEAGVEDASVPDRSRRVKATAHEELSDRAGPKADIVREKNDSTKSPDELLVEAEDKLAAGETLSAHRDLSKLFWNDKKLRPRFQETIDSTAKAIFFQSKPHYVEPYVIQEGDRLEVIAKKYHLSWEYVAMLNRTEPRRVQVGQKLKVMKGPFGAVVDLSEFALTVHLQGYYVKRYQVGIGKDSSSPNGEFTVLGKLENPQYTDTRTGRVIEGGDPKNPLGGRWIDLGDSYGIHGTIDPSSIGKSESRGCIRLRDADINEVYNFLVKGSEVIIRK